jgi:hypothetical protein
VGRPDSTAAAWRIYLLPLFLYGLLTLVMTFPLVVYLSERIVGEPYDATMFVWNMWWFKHALFDLHTNPFYTDYIFYPEGVNLYFQTICLVKVFLSIPLQYLFSIIVTYNIMVFVTFVGSGITAYLLGRYLIRDNFGAFICGVVFAFSTFRLVHTLGHLNLISTEWIPLFVLFLIKLLRRPTWSAALLTGLFFLLVALSSWYLAVGCILLGIVVLVWYLARGKVGVRHVAYLALAAALSGVCLMPLVVPMVRIITSGEQPTVGMTAHDQVYYSMDVVSPFIPSAKHFLFGGFAQAIYSQMAAVGMERDSYLGFIALVLSFIATRRVKKVPWLWIWCGAVFFVLALGPYLSIFGRSRFPRIHAIPLPYLILRNVPILSAARIPGRFIVFVTLAVAVLAGYGVRYLVRHHPVCSQKHRRLLCVAVLAVLICSENALLPYPMAQIGISKFHREIARDPARYSILDLPFEPGFSFYHYYQIYHGKKLIYGHIARTPYRLLREKQQEFHVSQQYDPGQPKKNLEFIRRFIHGMCQANGRYIVIHKQVATPQQMALLHAFMTDAELWRQADQPHPPAQCFEDQYLIVYEFMRSHERPTE